MNQVHTALLSNLLAERLSLRLSLANAAESVDQSLDDGLLTRAARLLAELAERGALLGKSAESPQTAADLLPKARNPA